MGWTCRRIPSPLGCVVHGNGRPYRFWPGDNSLYCVGLSFFFDRKLAALLNFRNKFITNDGPDHLRDLINPHNASFRLRPTGKRMCRPITKSTLMRETHRRKSVNHLFDVRDHHTRSWLISISLFNFCYQVGAISHNAHLKKVSLETGRWWRSRVRDRVTKAK
jgi:hypothetical protein